MKTYNTYRVHTEWNSAPVLIEANQMHIEEESNYLVFFKKDEPVAVFKHWDYVTKL